MTMKKMMMIMLMSLIISEAFSQGSKKQLQNLLGKYSSLEAEDWGRGTYGYREFTFQKGQWALTFTLALDTGMLNRVFQFRTYGHYKVLGKSEHINAYDAIFYEEQKFVTLLTSNEKLIKAFGLLDCGLKPFIEKNITNEGCALWPSVDECSEDHDLLALSKEGLLYFGVRPADNNMCTADKRPKSLLPPVKRTDHDTL